MYHNTFEIINFEVEIEKKCPFCGDPNYVEPPAEPKTEEAVEGVPGVIPTGEEEAKQPPAVEEVKENSTI